MPADPRRALRRKVRGPSRLSKDQRGVVGPVGGNVGLAPGELSPGPGDAVEPGPVNVPVPLPEVLPRPGVPMSGVTVRGLNVRVSGATVPGVV
jgi:hypothetical protein